MTYQHAKETQLAKLFQEAEDRRECLLLPCRNDAAALMRRLRTADIARPFRGMYARRHYWNQLSPDQRAQHVIRALSSRYSDRIFSHASAAIMHGLDVSWRLLKPLHVLTGYSVAHAKNPDVKFHRTKTPVGYRKNGANITSVEQTVVDCAAYYSFRFSLGIADSALHQGLTDKDRLQNYLFSRENRRGARKAKRVIKYADARADNSGESMVRAIMLECGLPVPELQVPIENVLNPGHFYYADFMFTRPDGTKVVVELDGKDKYQKFEMTHGKSSIDVIMNEREREAAITSHGILVARFKFEDACNPKVLVRRLGSYGIVPVAKK